MKISEVFKYHTPKHPLTSAETAYNYAMETNRRFPAGEHLIAQSPSYSFVYARDIIEGRWPMGEKAIKTNSHFEREYKRFLELMKGLK